jgi:hypothetical protein
LDESKRIAANLAQGKIAEDYGSDGTDALMLWEFTSGRMTRRKKKNRTPNKSIRFLPR